MLTTQYMMVAEVMWQLAMLVAKVMWQLVNIWMPQPPVLTATFGPIMTYGHTFHAQPNKLKIIKDMEKCI